jgi:hypothetical protein
MSAEPHDNDNAKRRSIDVEYTALRNEITKRIEMRQQIVTLTLTLAGIFLGVGLTRTAVALIYPPLATFLALAWAQNDFRIRVTAKYIRERIEASTPGLGYETFVQEERESKSGGLGAWRFLVLSYGGILLLTQLMAIGIEFSKWPFNSAQWALLGVAAAAVGTVIWLMATKMRV